MTYAPHTAPTRAPARYALQPRSLEALVLFSRGLAAVEVARQMGITHHTLHTYMRLAYATLGVHSRTEAVVLAIRAGLVPWGP